MQDSSISFGQNGVAHLRILSFFILGSNKSVIASWQEHSAKNIQSANSSKEDMRLSGYRTSYDADFAKALKVFYQSMNTIRGHFLRLKHYKPPVRTLYTLILIKI